MDYKKPQDTLVHGGIGLYPLTTADQVILSDGSRLEKDGKINANKLDGKTLAEIMLALYPVGAVYISVNSTSPASLFGGTWEQIEDMFLLASGSTYSAGSTGGEATHTLTTNEIPSHFHHCPIAFNTAGNNRAPNSSWTDNAPAADQSQSKTSSIGGSQPHNNMPPYLAVNMWKRVS